jgi:hypothetical protein
MGDFEPVCHWAMISSVYPFWFNMSYVFGSLFKLQDQIKRSQVMSRTYEILRERNTIERCSRYVIRSFVSWDIIKDKERSGCYEKGKSITVSDISLASILIESVLKAVPEQRMALSSILDCPALFLFKMPSITGSQIVQANRKLSVDQFSINEEFIGWKR